MIPIAVICLCLSASVLSDAGLATARAAMTAGVVSLPPSEQPIDEIARAGAHIVAQIPDQEKESFERPRMRELLPRLWAVLGEWTAAYLDAHPDASAERLVDALTAVEPVNVTAVQLATGDRAAYVVAASFSGIGTVFVTARVDAGQFRTLWSIADADAARCAPTYEPS